MPICWGIVDRIRRSAYHDLGMSVVVLRKGIWPETFFPLKYRVMALLEKVWRIALCLHSPHSLPITLSY